MRILEVGRKIKRMFYFGGDEGVIRYMCIYLRHNTIQFTYLSKQPLDL